MPKRKNQEVVELPSNLNEQDIQELLDEADDLEIEEITSENLRRAVVGLEKKKDINLEQRLKFENDHQKFLMSEVDLDEDLRRFSQLAASPPLIPPFTNLGGFRILRDLLQHPNTDILIEVLSVLQELTDPEVLTAFEDPDQLSKHFDELSLANLVISCIERLEKENDTFERTEAITSVLEICDNMIDFDPKNMSRFIQSEMFFSFLLKNLQIPSIESIVYTNVFAAEILSSFLQLDSKCAENVDPECLKSVLKVLYLFRKTKVDGSLVEEFMLNCFGCLDAMLLHPKHKAVFAESDGIELCLRMIKERKSACRSGLKTLSFALQHDTKNSTQLVQCGGLKYIFGVLMRKGVATKAHSTNEKEDEEFLLSIIFSLLRNCGGDELGRVVHKFVENKCEKLERLIELHQKYAEWLIGNVQEHSRLLKTHQPTPEDLDDRAVLYLDLCEKGLGSLQSCDGAILRLVNSGSVMLQTQTAKLMKEKGVPASQIYDVVSDFIELLPEESPEVSSNRELLETFLKMFEVFDTTMDAGI